MRTVKSINTSKKKDILLNCLASNGNFEVIIAVLIGLLARSEMKTEEVSISVLRRQKRKAERAERRATY